MKRIKPTPMPPKKTTRSPLLGLIPLILLLTSCARQFPDLDPGELVLVAPDLNEVQLDNVIRLRLQTTNLGTTGLVTVNGEDMSFNGTQQTWERDITLLSGHNLLIVEVMTRDEVTISDTLHAAYMPFEVAERPALLTTPLGGHTTTLLPGGAMLVAGGASSADGAARNIAYHLPLGEVVFQELPARMISPRVGHTAVQLSDGSVILVGGATVGAVSDPAELVETVERFNQESGTFAEMGVEGEPIRRIYHSAIYRDTQDGPLVDLYGGWGDVAYRPNPVLGVRDDVRSFLIRNDSLISRSPAPGPSIAEMSGQTLIPLNRTTPGLSEDFLLTNDAFESGIADPTGLVVSYTPIGIILSNAAATLTPRTQHTGILIAEGTVVIFGGRQSSQSEVVDVAELFIRDAGTFFSMPTSLSRTFLGRFGHTATLTGQSRILLMGGFLGDGQATTDAENFDFSFQAKR